MPHDHTPESACARLSLSSSWSRAWKLSIAAARLCACSVLLLASKASLAALTSSTAAATGCLYMHMLGGCPWYEEMHGHSGHRIGRLRVNAAAIRGLDDASQVHALHARVMQCGLSEYANQHTQASTFYLQLKLLHSALDGLLWLQSRRAGLRCTSHSGALPSIVSTVLAVMSNSVMLSWTASLKDSCVTSAILQHSAGGKCQLRLCANPISPE